MRLKIPRERKAEQSLVTQTTKVGQWQPDNDNKYVAKKAKEFNEEDTLQVIVVDERSEETTLYSGRNLILYYT